jgi:hypothetical protein
MQGVGLYLYSSTKEWTFANFRNNNIAQEFEKGTLHPHETQLPNF